MSKKAKKAKKADIGYSVQVIVKQLNNDLAALLYDMYEVSFTYDDIMESIGFFKENLQHFLETRIFTKK